MRFAPSCASTVLWVAQEQDRCSGVAAPTFDLLHFIDNTLIDSDDPILEGCVQVFVRGVRGTLLPVL